jgi:hypothetical protein
MTMSNAVLIVGSPATASTGDYTQLLSDYQALNFQVRAEMLDRILQGGSSSFSLGTAT